MSVANRFLITGAQGFVGRYLVAHLLENEPDCLVLGTGRSPRDDDVFTHSIAFGGKRFPAPVPGICRIASDETRYRYQKSDLLAPGSLEPLLRDFKPSTVIHLASGLRGDSNANLLRTNIEGTINLLETIGRSSAARPLVIYGSSGGVYGRAGEEGVGLSEEDSCEPIDMYSVSKLAAEHSARVVSRQHRIPILYVRLFNLVGPGQDERHVCGRFASSVVSMQRGLAEKRFTVGALGTTRDFVDVRDVARSLRLLSNVGAPGEVYNIASGTETRIDSILSELLSLASLTELVDVVSDPSIPSGVERHFASIRRLRDKGFEPSVSIQTSLSDLFQYYSAVTSVAPLR